MTFAYKNGNKLFQIKNTCQISQRDGQIQSHWIS